jgi:hypothetical protein
VLLRHAADGTAAVVIKGQRVGGREQFPVPGSRKSAVVNGPIQIIFLPDMDEQYAIRSENFVSKSDFSLQFRNGWELTDVSGNHDSTPVALELIKTINAARGRMMWDSHAGRRPRHQLLHRCRPCVSR